MKARSALGWLWRGYLAPHWPLIGLAALLMAVEGGSLGLFAALMEPMFDRVFVGGDSAALWGVGGVILAVFLMRAVTSLGQRTLLARVGEASSAAIRADMLRHAMALDGGFHLANPPGAMIERIQGDVGALSKVWAGLLTGLGRDAVSVVALFGVAVSVDWRWTLVALVGVPLLVLPALLVQRVVRRRAAAARAIAARMTTRLDEIFHGIATIKLNTLERDQARRFDDLAAERIEAETRTATGQAAIPSLIDIMTGLGFVGVLIYGGAAIQSGEKSLGAFMAFFTAISLAFEPLRRLGNLSGLWQTAAASIDRIRALLETRATILPAATPAALPSDAPDITFRDVTLAYGETHVLRGVTFSAEAGQTTAIVGPSGAGKSTLFHLLTRLVDPTSGHVTIAGTDTRDADLAALRQSISVVSQETNLFDESLRENITLGLAEVSGAALDAAIDAAGLSELVASLPDGLDTAAGPRGAALSGGQRQRVAIARALLRRAPVLLLDEATSALDSQTEAAVQAALTKAGRNRSTLVIAHRLSTVRNADKIVVIDAGRVVETGRHDQLMERGGHYAALVRIDLAEGETE